MKTVIEMAKDAGAGVGTSGRWLMTPNELERFAELVRADERENGQKWFDAVTAQHKQAILAEREACAKVCEQESKERGGVAAGPFVTDFGKHTYMSMAAGAENCAAAIRARSNT